jgi:dTDP-glucose 4,6-dehydratase
LATKTCLVTGGAGFLGAHLVAHLLTETEWNVEVWDKLTYAAENGRRLMEIGAFNNPRFSFVELDIAYNKFPAESTPDYVIHLAAETHVDRSIENPAPFLVANIMGTYCLLEWAKQQKQIQKFLHFSTDEVYGPANGEAFTEWSRHNPTNPYSATKSAGESLALAWANTYEVPVIVSHCANVFGEMQNAEKYIPKLIGQIQRGETVQIHAREDGVCGSRMYVHASDVARAIVMLLDRGAIEEKYNIPGQEVSNLVMAQKVAGILGKPLIAQTVYPYKERQGWDFSYKITGHKLQELGWEPSENFDALLRQTVESYL